MSNDDDILTGAIADPDTEATAQERARARSFAELVDKTLAGRTPGVMSTDDRALLEVATVIRAATADVELAPEKRSSIVEAALRKAVGDTKKPAAAAIAVVPVTRARRAPRAPWIVTGTSMLVAAAAVVLWIRVPRPSRQSALPENQTMRPTDPLIGPIPHEHGDTTARIDTIFADRLDGFRDRRFGGAR